MKQPTTLADSSNQGSDTAAAVSETRFVTPKADKGKAEKSNSEAGRNQDRRSNLRPTAKTPPATNTQPGAKPKPTFAKQAGSQARKADAQGEAGSQTARESRSGGHGGDALSLSLQAARRRGDRHAPRQARRQTTDVEKDPAPIEKPTQPPKTDIVQTPPKTTAPVETGRRPTPVKKQPKPPTDQVVEQPPKTSKPEVSDDPPEAT